MKKGKIVAIILAIVVIVIIVLVVLNRKPQDNIRFSKEYTNVSENNVFVYRDIKDIIKIMEHGTGVVYLGFPECPWCQAYVKYLDEVSKEVGIEKIYYYNILEDRKNNTSDYQKIVELLEGNLQFDQDGNPRIYVPNVSFHINGKLIGNDYETSLDTHNLSDPKEYWTTDEVSELKEVLKEYMQQVDVALSTCTGCNK